jgi:DNA-binding XRE family transcriptional regulator
MAKDWKRLADAVRDARKRHDPPLRQEDLAERAQVSLGSIQTLERGTGYTRMPRAAYSVAHALGWTTESIDAVLDGGDPTRRDQPGAAPTAPAGSTDYAARLPLAVRDALSAGELVDTEVLDLGPDDSGMRMIVVVTREERSAEDVEEMRARLAEWAKKKTELRRIATDSE